MRLDEKVLRARAPSNLEVSFRPDSVARALRNRLIVPSLYTTILVTSILPGVRALGGCRHVIYYPIMRYLTAIVLERSGNLDLLRALEKDHHPRAWGHRVLKPAVGYPFQEMELAGGISPLLSAYGDLPLAQSSGDLTSFTRDPTWAAMSGHINAGTITSACDAGRWSGS